MRVLSSTALAALDSGRFAARNGFYVQMPSETVAFWDDAYASTIDGVTYEPGAGVFTISAYQSTADLVTRSLDITLSGIDTGIATRIMDEPWHQRPVIVSRFVIATDAPAVIHAKQWFAGFIDVIEWREKVRGPSELVAHCEDIGRELGRKGARTRSASDQRQLAPDDAFFDGVVAAINAEVSWGRIVTQQVQQPQRQKLFGIF